MNKNRFLELIIIFSLIIIIYLSISRELADDLTFDYVGYALRMNSIFDSWTNQFGIGIPTTTFIQSMPLFIPLLFKSLGFGTVTLPITLSILLLRLLVPFAFIQLKKVVNINWRLLVLLGILFVINPITFNFLHRYLEFTAWLFFVFAFSFFYKFLSEKKFNRNNFLFSVLFSTLTILSHTIPTIFLFLSFIFLSKSKNDLKKAGLIILSSFCLSAFWLIPTIFFKDYSVLGLGQQALTGIKTQGIFLTGIFTTIALFFTVAFSFILKIPKSDYRLFQLFLFTFLLSIIKFLFPMTPIISAIFAHSYHTFFILILLLFTAVLIEKKIIKNMKLISAASIIVIIIILVSFPLFERRYATEPKLSEIYDLEKLDALFIQVPKNARVQALPYTGDLTSFSAYRHGFSMVYGYVYFPLKQAEPIKELIHSEMNSYTLDCNSFNSVVEETAITYWLAHEQKGNEYLQKCGMIPLNSELPILLKYPKEVSLVENGTLISLENTKIVVDAQPPETLIKINYFPRWTAKSSNKEIPVKMSGLGMKILVDKPQRVELIYAPAIIDWISIAISLIALFCILFFMLISNKKNKILFSWERMVSNNKTKEMPIFIEHIERYNFAAKLVKAKTVLDAACGTGYGSQIIYKSGAKKVVGIDNDKDTLKYAKNNYPKITFKQADAANMKAVSPKSFDVVVSFETIEHLKEYEKFLSEITRVLKDNGKIIISTPNSVIRKNSFTDTPINPFHFREFDDKEFSTLLRKYFNTVKLYGQGEIKNIKKGPSKMILDFIIAMDFLKLRKYFIGILGEPFRNLVFEKQKDLKVKEFVKGKNYFTITAICENKITK